MFTSIDKAIVALAMSIEFLLSNHGVNIPEWFNEDWLTSFLALLAPIAVWAMPNKDKGGGNAPT